MLYTEKFRVGTEVMVEDTKFLSEFMDSWKWHHPFDPEQLAGAGILATVRDVGFYHAGDVLYHLHGVPGIWHEQCLRPSQRL
jgi:hypothetical protein